MKNNILEYNHAKQFVTDAIADGWKIKPTYVNHEPVDSAASLEKNGYKMMVLTREHNLKLYPNVKRKYEVSIFIWGSDGLHVDTPSEYSWNTIVENSHTCSNCHKQVEETVRYSFAGRCCKDCLPEMQQQHEQPGWCD